MSRQELIISGPNGLMGATLHLPSIVAQGQTCPVVIWVHGFKGFRSWGHFPIIADWWAAHGYACLRFDFSHNGTHPNTPLDFSNLEAFGRNTYTKELTDLLAVIDYVHTIPAMQSDRVFMVGHSRGGAAVLLAANRTDKVRAVGTLAAIGTILRFAPENIAEWRHQGVTYVDNSRTGQRMPIYDDIFKDWEIHSRDYNLKQAARSLKVPYLQIHGSADTTVTPAEASALHLFNQQADYMEIPEANHTFGGAHPWNSAELPEHSQQALQALYTFFNRCP